VLHATSLRIPIVEVEGGSLTALAGFDGHQGVALVVEPRRFATIDDVLARAADRGEPPFVLVLDSLEDPHNVGSLLRSAEGAGVHGVLFPVRRQAPLTPSAIKASAGAVEHLLLCPVDDMASALVDLHGHGIWVAGADSDAALTARQTDLRGPIALVVGSEGQGLGPAVRKRCDLFVRIPLRGAIGSLNAAVAGSVLLFEVAAQRDPDGTAPRTAARNVPISAVDVPHQGPVDASPAAVGGPGAGEVGAPVSPASQAAVTRRRRAAANEMTVDAAPPVADEPAAAVTTASTDAEPSKAKPKGKAKAEIAATSKPKGKAEAEGPQTKAKLDSRPKAKKSKPKAEPAAESMSRVTKAKPSAGTKPAAGSKPKATKVKPAIESKPKDGSKAKAKAMKAKADPRPVAARTSNPTSTRGTGAIPTTTPPTTTPPTKARTVRTASKRTGSAGSAAAEPVTTEPDDDDLLP